jgi:hypothetical protein
MAAPNSRVPAKGEGKAGRWIYIGKRGLPQGLGKLSQCSENQVAKSSSSKM